MIREGALRVPGIADASTLDDGEVLDVPGRPRVIHVPGHTPGSCALFLGDRKLLFSGDALVTFDPVTEGAGPRVLSKPFAADEEEAIRSLDRLQETGAAVVLSGRGEPWKDGVAEAVRLARATRPA